MAVNKQAVLYYHRKRHRTNADITVPLSGVPPYGIPDPSPSVPPTVTPPAPEPTNPPTDPPDYPNPH